MTRGFDPAYPTKKVETRGEGDHRFQVISFESGLTKRELFAAMAMQGILANCGDVGCRAVSEEVASQAVEDADALIAALGKPTG